MHLRDTTYDMGKPSVRDLCEAFLLHLSITLACAVAARSPLGFLQHLHVVADKTDLEQKYAANLLLQATLLGNVG